MILVTRMDKQEMYLNPDHIISIEETPDTVIALYNGHHFIVKERAQVIIDRIIAFRSRIIRRSSAGQSHKLRTRDRRSLFASVTANHDMACATEMAEQRRSPFHHRDI